MKGMAHKTKAMKGYGNSGGSKSGGFRATGAIKATKSTKYHGAAAKGKKKM